MNMDHHRYFVASLLILLYLTSCSSVIMMQPVSSSSEALVASGSGNIASISSEVYATQSSSINIETTTASSVVRSNNVIAPTSVAPTSVLSAAPSASMMNPLPSVSPTPESRPPSTCSEQVDHILIELSGLANKTNEEILDDFCEITIVETNSYCRRNWADNCQLPSGFTGEYNLSSCHACYKNLRLKAVVTSSLRYFLTQPNNANSVLNSNAMLNIARQALPSFEASTGLNAVHVSSFNANPPTTQNPSEKDRNDLIKFLKLWGILGGLILACAIVVIIVSIIIAVACCIKMKTKKRVEPNKRGKEEKGFNNS